ncbi:hypothetical protein OnM2_042074 [Erysiphe neolycopersici]|uniref:Uncharacterized protein n=1 Tax=Erysiphe neolycopersici TaxID=212602 RepID=A0A420HVD1_9PEZI|nr:hypothetical protein OnM2_042074 [Erysiphe neolycopersici]
MSAEVDDLIGIYALHQVVRATDPTPNPGAISFVLIVLQTRTIAHIADFPEDQDWELVQNFWEIMLIGVETNESTLEISN